MIEVLLIRHVHWLHALYLAIGVAIFALASVRESRAGELAKTVRSMSRAALHALVGWALCGATMGTLLATTSAGTARLGHLFAAPIIFAGIGASYFRKRQTWAPLPAAAFFVLVVGLLDLVVVASFIRHDLAMFRSFDGFWGPALLIFIATWVVGAIRGQSTHGSARGAEGHGRA